MYLHLYTHRVIYVTIGARELTYTQTQTHTYIAGQKFTAMNQKMLMVAYVCLCVYAHTHR